MGSRIANRAPCIALVGRIRGLPPHSRGGRERRQNRVREEQRKRSQNPRIRVRRRRLMEEEAGRRSPGKAHMYVGGRRILRRQGDNRRAHGGKQGGSVAYPFN